MLSALCSAAQPVFAAAGDDYFDLPPEQLLKAEVISVSKKEEPLSDAPAAVYVITSDDIMRSGVTTIPDALRMAPGVQVAEINSHSWAISIRGFDSQSANKLLVLIDGRTVYDSLFSGTYWEAQDLVLEDIDRIEVVRGPGGTLWGANAVNGVINIITKRAKDTQGDTVTLTAGNHELGTITGEHGGSFGDDDYYRTYAKYFDRNSYTQPNGSSAQDSWDSYRAGFRADWGDKFTLEGDAYQTDDSQIGGIPDVPVSPDELDNLTYRGGNVLGRWTDKKDDGSQLMVQSYLDYSQREDPILLDDHSGTFDLLAQYNFAQLGRHDIIVGGGYRLETDQEDGTPVVSFNPASRTDNLFNVFAQDKITLLPDSLFLTLGSKFEHNDYTGFEYEPNARLQWHPDAANTFWAAVSRAVRTPSRLEDDVDITLGGYPGPSVVTITGNKDFDSEQLVAYEIGYRNQVTPDLSLDTTAFYNDYSQLAIYQLQTPTVVIGPGGAYTLYPLTTINGMRGQTDGFEVAADWAARPNWKLSLSYSYLNVALQANTGIDSEAAEGLSPHNQIGLRSLWSINQDWTADSTLYYVSQLREDNLPDYVRLDVNIGYRITDGLRFNLVGQNLTGEHQEFGTSPSAIEIGRSIFGKLTWQF